jgi:hypothetical protein
MDLTNLLQPGSRAAAPQVTLPAQPKLADEERIDLPMRSPAEIAELLKSETPEQTQRRIENDHARYLSMCSRRSGL